MHDGLLQAVPLGAYIPAAIAKMTTSMASSEIGTGEAPHGSHHHSGKRLRQLLHLSGRRIHIAANPEEHERLKLTLSTSEPDEQFDVCIHGSDEHLAAVREIHAHTEQQRIDLRKKHAVLGTSSPDRP